MNQLNPELTSVRRWIIFFDVVKIVFIATIVVGIVRFFIAQPFLVSGDSMVPTFYPNDYLVIDELTYERHLPQYGDVVVFHYPLDPSIYFIKRIIGLPGDTVVVTNGNVFVRSGKGIQRLLTEPYVNPGVAKEQFGTTTLGVDEYFVLGDNRNSSFDSRVWGPVPRRYIVGRAFVRIYPFTHETLYRAAVGATSTPVVPPTLSTGR